MTGPWAYAGAPEPLGDSEVTLMEGTTFCISDPLGDVGSHLASGLYVRDSRVLSHWRLTMTTWHLEPLRVHRETPHSGTFLLLAQPGPDTGGSELLVTRRRLVGEGMREDFMIKSTGPDPTRLELMLAIDADFADLFAVKDGRASGGPERRIVVTGESLDLSTVVGDSDLGVTVTSDPPAAITPSGLRWEVDLDGHGTWTSMVQVVVRVRGRRLEPHHAAGVAPELAVPERRRKEFRSNVPRLVTADRALADAIERSIDDVGTLRIFDPDSPASPVIAAGSPWFMALFGRDSLLTSMMWLPFDPGLLAGTLTTLAAHQGTRVDLATEEEPGRILHEVRLGPDGTLALGGRNAYYGTVDATPLFVMAVAELLRWHPSTMWADLIPHADRALTWMREFGDRDGDGFIEYARSTDAGLVNQGWKDSWDGINFADGTIAQPPIALAEVQAYAFAAYVARSDLAAATGDDVTARRWRGHAMELKSSFNEAFWLPDRGWYAVGLDHDKRPIDALTSNIGHCLWTGIADDDKAARVVEHLMSPEMFTGWGIRTLGAGMGAFNPMSYHNGSVWPHDTAICASGMARYGYLDEAQDVMVGLVDAAAYFAGRLPELFGGFSRGDPWIPVPYPAACSPQAWASAAPVQLLRALLRLEPAGAALVCNPALPERMLPLTLTNVGCRGRRYDIEVNRGESYVREGGLPR
ncbi:amylo-alpha-1,6-glucosidase [Nocardioides dilutus]